MPVDRPRRALLEEPDDVESYVAKRSLGFTQAESGDRLVVRPARATRALEPSAIGAHVQTAEHEHLKVSGSPARRALPAESLSWHLDEEEPAPSGSRTTGRRAIVDPEPTQSSPSVLSQPAPLQVTLEPPQPRRGAPSPSFELPNITSPEIRPQDPMPAAAPPAAISVPQPAAVQSEQRPAYRPTPSPISAAQPAAVQSEQRPAYRPTPPIESPPAPLPQTPTVERTNPPLRRAQGVGQIAQSAVQVAQNSVEITHAVPIRPASRVGVADRPAATPRPGSGQAVRRPPARAVSRVRTSRRAVRHEVPPVIVNRLIKSYNGTLAVHNLSFVVQPGRVTGFLGPNGAGKTTTMRILLGLVTATTGTATFGGLAYADLPHPQQTVGCVLDACFHPGRSGRNHLRVLAPTAGTSDRRVDKLLAEVGLGEVARYPVGEYSMGMQQRLALAAAMLGDPDYLILDEPANGLDPEGIRWLRTFLRDFAASGRTVFISSHLLNEIEATADDIVVINKGRLLAQMPISELNLREGTTRARVSDLSTARQALAAIGAEVEIAADERGAYLRIHGHDAGHVGSALFGSGIAVDELVTERRDLEQEFFAMLEGSR
jgi:ABC-2 type transport system ATP-binding protein